MKKQKNNIILFIAIFILGALTTIFFLNFHTVPDTYNVLWQKQEYETTFLKDGRVLVLYSYIWDLGLIFQFKY